MSMGNSDCASGDSSSAPQEVGGLAPQPIRYGHLCRLGRSGMGGQDLLDLKKPNPTTSHDDYVIGASSERARAVGVLLRTVAGQMIAPTERFYQGQERPPRPTTQYPTVGGCRGVQVISCAGAGNWTGAGQRRIRAILFRGNGGSSGANIRRCFLVAGLGAAALLGAGQAGAGTAGNTPSPRRIDELIGFEVPDAAARG